MHNKRRAPLGSIRPGATRAGSPSPFIRSDAGFTLIEVLVSALMVVLLSGAAATSLVATTDSSSDLRVHADAEALAQQNQAQMHGLNVDQLSNLNSALPAVSLNGVSFTVTETATYVSASSGVASCTHPSADYLQTTSTVTWSNMGNRAPVTVSSILTPTVGSIDPTHGTLAVSATNAGGAGNPGMNVAISGPSAASELTTATGCVLFGDLPAGTYTVRVSPPSGIYVDAKTGNAVTPSAPDTASINVVAGTIPASASFDLDQSGSITYSFTDAFPPPGGLTAPVTPTVPAVVAFNTYMSLPSSRVCTLADAACPPVGNADTSFPASDWGGASGQVTATPLFPFTSPYSLYAGICGSDDPHVVSSGAVTDASAAVSAGGNTPVTLTLPAMVVKLYSGASTGTSEMALPAGAHLIITDTGCNVRYIGYLGAAPTVATNQAALPLNPSYPPSSNDTGILAFPGMPYGNYTVCYDNNGQKYSTTATNAGTGVLVALLAGSTTTGIC